eukprot:COSAG02_NODE_2535_length_8585_cov_3.664624_6_plen_91_part_00
MVCLDTSGSMSGAREALSKALALKCISAAHAKKRPCYLYAFGGAAQLAEIEVRIPSCDAHVTACRQVGDRVHAGVSGSHSEMPRAICRSG